MRHPDAVDYEALLDMIGSANPDVLSRMAKNLTKKYGTCELTSEQTLEFLKDLKSAFKEAQENGGPSAGSSGSLTSYNSGSLTSKSTYSDTSPANNLSTSMAFAVAEMSFCDGKAALDNGRFEEAISLFREAISYNPNIASYYYYLSLALAISTKGDNHAEAKAMLLKAVELDKDNADYQTQLGVIYREEGELYKATTAFAHALSVNPSHTVASRELAAIHNVETKKERRPTNPSITRGTTRTMVEPLDVSTSPSQEGIKAFSESTNGYSTSLEEIKTLSEAVLAAKENTKIISGNKQFPKRIKSINLFILGVIIVVAILSVPLSRKVMSIEIIPLVPHDQAILDGSHLEFRWTSSSESVDYLLQIEDLEEKILERYTRENMYVLSKEDVVLLKADRQYKWRVIPVSPKREKLNYTTQTLEFVLSTVPAAALPFDQSKSQ
ncbi:MAG: hypothetical protein AB1489_24465 [Acidobacteriota bacterium]